MKAIDAVICDLRHLLISMEEFRENGDANKLQKRIGRDKDCLC